MTAAAITGEITALVNQGSVRVTQHATAEMLADHFDIDDVLEVLRHCQLLENYPDHKRGSCCLVGGIAQNGRAIHIVCTTGQPVLIIITVYEPRLPKWLTPERRGLT